MNAKAKALGVTHTRFVEPTGLSIHNVDARDLTKLLIATKQYPLIPVAKRTRANMSILASDYAAISQYQPFGLP